ncbi:MAG: helix-turn-helix transcriptional regulator [Hyphomicrobiaceae bacterium]|nr:helix-turn-helix transcriptional regulator [Hyphomicrobiaceae bacterium]
MAQDRTRDRILLALKRDGALTAQAIADQFSLSLMGAHKALQGLSEDGLVRTIDRPEGRGRPRRFFELTGTGHRQFADRHAAMTAELLSDISEFYGSAGLERLVGAREERQRQEYAAISGSALGQRAETLAAIRDRDGYMARLEPLDDGALLLIEDHCPICAAAEACQGFCRSELDLFRLAMGATATVERAEHLFSGGRRCAYRIAPA